MSLFKKTTLSIHPSKSRKSNNIPLDILSIFRDMKILITFKDCILDEFFGLAFEYLGQEIFQHSEAIQSLLF